MEYSQLYIFLACTIGLLMSWGVGANDLANIMSTTMGSKAVSVRQALIIAVIFEFAGALLGSHDVTHTLRSGIINLNMINMPQTYIYGMLAVLLAGTTWMLLASFFGLPVSITNAIVGSIVGFGSLTLGLHAIQWNNVSLIALTWICSPLLAGVMAYLLLMSIQRFILGATQPLIECERYLPFYLIIVGIVLTYMIVLKGLQHFSIHLGFLLNTVIVIICTALITFFGKYYIHRKAILAPTMTRRDRFAAVEKMFSILMALTACAMVFAHGSNDVAIAVGPMSAVVTTVIGRSDLFEQNGLTSWVLFLGSSGVIAGFVMYGRKVIETVGSGITTLTPSRAFAATLAAAVTVILSTSIGIPVSATQTLVGAVLGAGLARGIGALNLVVIRNIFMSWIITLPAASILAIIYYYMFTYIFS